MNHSVLELTHMHGCLCLLEVSIEFIYHIFDKYTLLTGLFVEIYNVNIANSTWFEENKNIFNFKNVVLFLRTFSTQMLCLDRM